MVIAHRGASGLRPEHTLAAYKLAVEQGADAVEPDVVPSKDGVLVVRHEPNISFTTDVAEHPEFADRRCEKLVDGVIETGWFVEDFTWAELATLRCIERIPEIRPLNAKFDGKFPLLRLRDLLDYLATDPLASHIIPVVEVKHATTMQQRGFNMAKLLAKELAHTPFGNGRKVIIESFELTVLLNLRHMGVDAEYVFLLERDGYPFDELHRRGAKAAEYRAYLKEPALGVLAQLVDGVSIERKAVLPDSRIPDGAPKKVLLRAQAAGLKTYIWTVRPENRFLPPRLQTSGGPGTLGTWEPYYKQVMGLGLDGVFTDYPEMMRRVIK